MRVPVIQAPPTRPIGTLRRYKLLMFWTRQERRLETTPKVNSRLYKRLRPLWRIVFKVNGIIAFKISAPLRSAYMRTLFRVEAPTDVKMVACQICGFEAPESGDAQNRHMEERHPEVIEQRLRDAGFVFRDGRWVDTQAAPY